MFDGVLNGILNATGPTRQELYVLIAIAVVVIIAFGIGFARFLNPPRRKRPARGFKARAIIVDGSNVMHWGSNIPTILVLQRVVQTLSARGYDSYVYFDANVGYKLYGRFTSRQELATLLKLPTDQVHICPSGQPADDEILAHATSNNLKVVTNDRFRDWHEKYPQLYQKRILVKGDWQEGRVTGLKLTYHDRKEPA